MNYRNTFTTVLGYMLSLTALCSLPALASAQTDIVASAEPVTSMDVKRVGGPQSDEWDKAITSANQAIKDNPRNFAAYINRSRAYAELGQSQRAIIDANKAILLNHHNPLGYTNRGHAFELDGRINEARADYRHACNLNYQPACGYAQKLDWIGAADIAKRVSQLFSRSDEKFVGKQWQDVVALNTLALRLDPGNVAAYANRAGALIEMGKLPDALIDSKKAIYIDPQYGAAHNNQAYVYELMGKQKEAAQSYKNACELGLKASCADYQRMAASLASS